MKRVLKIVGIFLVIIVIGVFISSRFKKPGYTLDKVTKDSVEEYVSESGALTVNVKADIYSPSTGIVQEVFVSNGAVVAEGQELFTVKSIATQQEKQAAYSDYLIAKNSLSAAQASAHSLQSTMFDKWDEYKELAETDTYENSDGTPKHEQRAVPEFHIAQKDWYAAEASYKNQQSVISQAQARTSATWLAYQSTQNATVKAPVSGTVSNLAVSPGTSVTVHSAVAPSTPVLSVGNFNKTEGVLLLGEDDIVKVKEGQEAKVTVDPVDNKVYQGKVVRTDTIGTDLNGVVRYKVFIEILDADEQLLPGMSMDADILSHKQENVLTVPNAAVKPYKGGKAVRVPGKKKGEIEFVPVIVGIRGDARTQIISGLSEGQEIIVATTGETAKKSGPFGF